MDNYKNKYKNKKVALFITSLRAGGGEKAMVELATAFVDYGYDVDLVVMKAEGALLSQVDRRVKLVDLEVGRIITTLPKLLVYLKKEEPRVIMSVDEYSHLISIIAVKISGKNIRVVLRIGNIYSELFKRYQKLRDKFLIPFLIKYLYKKADAIIANSKGVANDIFNITNIPEEKISIIYNPKNINKIESLMNVSVSHEWFNDKKLPIILGVGRLREQKNFSLLIRVFSRLQKKIPSRLVILGVGREESKLRALVKEFNISDSVYFAGYVENPYAYMSKADIFAFPSLWEGMPNSLIEALICGLPSVSSDCDSGPREVLAPESDYYRRLHTGNEEVDCGFLVAVNDEYAFENSLKEILKSKELKLRFSMAAKKRGNNFNIEKGIKDYEQALGLI